MGVSVEGGKGRSKSMMVDLNLVPFIDFMSCLIAFLMIAAVWTQVAALEVEQSISVIPSPPPSDIPPLTIHIRADGTSVGRDAASHVQIAKLGQSYDLARLREQLVTDHNVFPAEDMVIIYTDDGVPYEAMVQALDLSRELGYPRTQLAGGPASLASLPTLGG